MMSEPPRNVPMKLRLRWLRDRAASFAIGVFGLFFLALAMPLVIVLQSALQSDVDYGRLQSEGQSASGVVMNAWERTNVSVNGRHPLVIEYSYEVNGAQRTGTMDTMDYSEVSGWKRGQQIAVVYLGEQSMIAGVEPFVFPFWIFFLAFGGAGGLCVPFLLYAWAGSRKKAAAYSRGRIGKAKLLSVEDRSRFVWFPFWRPKRFVAAYSFEAASGRVIVGTCLTSNMAWANAAQTGQEVDVLYLPEDERVNCLVDAMELRECNSAA